MGVWQMGLQIAVTNVAMNAQAEEYIKRKLAKLQKHLPGILDIKVEVSGEDTRSAEERYLVKLLVNSKVADSVFHTEGRGPDLLRAVDRAATTMTRQLERYKGKLYDRGRNARRIKPAASVNEPREVVKIKHFVIEPMSLQEAITQMERLGHDFFLYTDELSHEPRLLYRRHDGNYGIIEPEFK